MPDAEDPIDDAINKAGDEAISRATGGWWSRADDEQKIAVGVIVAGAILGPMGQGFLGVIQELYKPQIPSLQQLTAVIYLFVLTLPVAAAAGFFAAAAGRVAPVSLLIVAALFAIGGAAAVGKVTVPSLHDFYCYNDGVILEKECRVFNQGGFMNSVSQGGSSGPSWALKVLAYAFAYTADARGWVMAFAGVMAGAGTGYLIRHAQT